MSLKTRIRELRARDRLSQEDLARKVGVRRETIGNLENGRYNPSLKLAMDIAKVFVLPWKIFFSSLTNQHPRTDAEKNSLSFFYETVRVSGCFLSGIVP